MDNLPKAYLLILSIALWAGPATASSHASEGAILAFGPGDTFTWALAPEQYFIIIHAGATDPTADFDVQDMGSSYAFPVLHLEPRGTHGGAINVGPDETRTLKVLNGTGHLVLARLDLMRNLPPYGPPSSINVSGKLDAGECKTYPYSLAKMSSLAAIEAAGDDVRFTAFTFSLDMLEQKTSVLSMTADPNEESSVVIQACNDDGAGARTFEIQGTYPAPETPGPTRGIPHLPFAGVAAAIFGATSVFRRR